ncbi:MAG: hypothetical protein M1833_001056 [Piccolia ochrophora]|nr:MAG: hypothetical protein M1833_001056 [Piccolia ochrophora]
MSSESPLNGDYSASHDPYSTNSHDYYLAHDTDSHMQSSASPSASPDVDSEDVMFPAPVSSDTNDNSPVSTFAHGQSLPAPHLTAPVSELSPPNSQGETMPGGSGTAAPLQSDMMDYVASQPTDMSRFGLGNKDREKAKESTDAQDFPGSAWNNKRAHEDYARAVEGLLDRQFSLEHYGDLYDESDMAMR